MFWWWRRGESHGECLISKTLINVFLHCRFVQLPHSYLFADAASALSLYYDFSISFSVLPLSFLCFLFFIFSFWKIFFELCFVLFPYIHLLQLNGDAHPSTKDTQRNRRLAVARTVGFRVRVFLLLLLLSLSLLLWPCLIFQLGAMPWCPKRAAWPVTHSTVIHIS